MTFHAAPPRVATVRSNGFALGSGIGVMAGFVLPVIAALLFRTYDYSVTPASLEAARQLGVVYLIGELTVVIYARRRGLDIAAMVRALPRWTAAALGLFLATFWLSSAFVSQQPVFSIGLCLGWVIHLLFAASLFHLAKTAPVIDARDIAVGFVAGLIALAGFIALQFAAVPAALSHRVPGVDLGSAIPGFISHRLFGSWCGAVLALLTGIAWRAPAAHGHRTLYLMIALAFGLTFWTATRAALLGWAVVLPVAWLLVGRPVPPAFYRRLPLYLLAATVVALALPPYGSDQFTLIRWNAMATPDAVASGRLTLWTNALRVVADYPLFGSGAGSSWWLVPLGDFYHVQPHNVIVQFLLNWGLVPTIPALALLAAAVRQAHRSARRRPELLPIILMLDTLLVMGLFDGMFHFAQFTMLIVGCLALCLARGDSGAAHP